MPTEKSRAPAPDSALALTTGLGQAGLDSTLAAALPSLDFRRVHLDRLLISTRRRLLGGGHPLEMPFGFAHGRLARQFARRGRERPPISCTRNGTITTGSKLLQDSRWRKWLCGPNAARMLPIRTIFRGGRTEPRQINPANPQINLARRSM